MSHRILIVPGYVQARDGQRHYIDASALMRLYQLTPEEKRRAIVRYPDRHPAPGFRARPDDEVLSPRRDGNYTRRQVEPA